MNWSGGPTTDGARVVMEKGRGRAKICRRNGQGTRWEMQISAEKRGRKSPSSLGSPQAGVFGGDLYPTWGLKQAGASPLPGNPQQLALRRLGGWS